MLYNFWNLILFKIRCILSAERYTTLRRIKHMLHFVCTNVPDLTAFDKNTWHVHVSSTV